jgi:hypothetical protein
MKNAVHWYVMPCGFCKNEGLGGTYRLHHQGENRRERNNVSRNYQPKHAANAVIYIYDIQNGRQVVASTSRGGGGAVRASRIAASALQTYASILLNRLINPTSVSTSREAATHAATQEIIRILRNEKIHCHDNKSQPLINHLAQYFLHTPYRSVVLTAVVMEDVMLWGCSAVQTVREPTFRRNASPPSTRS